MSDFRSLCAACGATDDLHEHHLIPRVHGGLDGPTVMLCGRCHGIVHAHEFGQSLGDLVRAGRAKAKAAGRPVGGWPKGTTPESNAKARATARALAAAHAETLRPVVEAMIAAGISQTAMLARLNAEGHLTRRGNPWRRSTLQELLKVVAGRPRRVFRRKA
jgi:hypothetical protein